MSTFADPDLAALAVRVTAPRRDVFRFLADVENVPSWGAEFCERIELARGRWLALTSAGELFAELEADERSGVVDVRFGDAEEIFAAFSLRVTDGPAADSVVSVALARTARESVERFAMRRELVAGGLRRLSERWPRACAVRVA